jgi:hypothetical protein
MAVRTVYGRLADQLGYSSAAGRFAASPAAAYLREQNPEIPIDRDHDHRAVGSIVFLARNGGNLPCRPQARRPNPDRRADTADAGDEARS